MALGVDTHTHTQHTHGRILWWNESNFKKPGGPARAWFKNCAHVSNYLLSLNTLNTLISVLLFLVSHMRMDLSPNNT